MAVLRQKFEQNCKISTIFEIIPSFSIAELAPTIRNLWLPDKLITNPNLKRKTILPVEIDQTLEKRNKQLKRLQGCTSVRYILLVCAIFWWSWTISCDSSCSFLKIRFWLSGYNSLHFKQCSFYDDDKYLKKKTNEILLLVYNNSYSCMRNMQIKSVKTWLSIHQNGDYPNL